MIEGVIFSTVVFLVPLVLVALSIAKYRRYGNRFFALTATAFGLELVAYAWLMALGRLGPFMLVGGALLYLIGTGVLIYAFATYSETATEPGADKELKGET